MGMRTPSECLHTTGILQTGQLEDEERVWPPWGDDTRKPEEDPFRESHELRTMMH